MKNLMKEAHKMTKGIKAKYENVDYKAQLGLCLSFLLENKEEVEMTKAREEKWERINYSEFKNLQNFSRQGLDFIKLGNDYDKETKSISVELSFTDLEADENGRFAKGLTFFGDFNLRRVVIKSIKDTYIVGYVKMGESLENIKNMIPSEKAAKIMKNIASTLDDEEFYAMFESIDLEKEITIEEEMTDLTNLFFEKLEIENVLARNARGAFTIYEKLAKNR